MFASRESDWPRQPPVRIVENEDSARACLVRNCTDAGISISAIDEWNRHLNRSDCGWDRSHTGRGLHQLLDAGRRLPAGSVELSLIIGGGFGLVYLEALGTGLPFLCTTNSGGPDIIRDEVEGHCGARRRRGDRGWIQRCFSDETILPAMAEAARRCADCWTGLDSAEGS